MSLTQTIEQPAPLILQDQTDAVDYCEHIPTAHIDNESLDDPDTAEVFAIIEKTWRPGSIISQLAISYTCVAVLWIKATALMVNSITQNNTLPEPGIIPTFFAFAIPFGIYVWDEESIPGIVNKFISKYAKLNKADIEKNADAMKKEAENIASPLGLEFEEVINQLVRKKIPNKWVQDCIISHNSGRLWYAFAAERLAKEQRKKMSVEF